MQDIYPLLPDRKCKCRPWSCWSQHLSCMLLKLSSAGQILTASELSSSWSVCVPFSRQVLVSFSSFEILENRRIQFNTYIVTEVFMQVMYCLSNITAINWGRIESHHVGKPLWGLLMDTGPPARTFKWMYKSAGVVKGNDIQSLISSVTDQFTHWSVFGTAQNCWLSENRSVCSLNPVINTASIFVWYFQRLRFLRIIWLWLITSSRKTTEKQLLSH